jgi:hypothetical protein
MTKIEWRWRSRVIAILFVRVGKKIEYGINGNNGTAGIGLCFSPPLLSVRSVISVYSVLSFFPLGLILLRDRPLRRPVNLLTP